MNGNIFMSAGVAVGIFVGLIVAFVMIKLANSNRKVKSEYDERQLRVRGDAYRYAFYTVVIWEAVLIVLAYGDFHLPVPDLALHFAGIIAGVIVLSTICIWKDAYWGLNNNRRSYGITALCWLWSARSCCSSSWRTSGRSVRRTTHEESETEGGAGGQGSLPG